MDKPFFEQPPNLPMHMIPPGPSDDTIIRRMKDAYIEEHPGCTDDDLDVVVEHVSRYLTNVKLVVKPKVSYIKINTYIDHKEDEECI
jgi:hypothetical protein